MVEAAEVASIYNVLKCRWKAKSAQKLPLKLLKKCRLQLDGIGRNRITSCPHGSDNRKRSRRDNVPHEERSRFRHTHCRCPSLSAAGRRHRQVRFDSATDAHRCAMVRRCQNCRASM